MSEVRTLRLTILGVVATFVFAGCGAGQSSNGAGQSSNGGGGASNGSPVVEGDLGAVCAAAQDEGELVYWATLEPDNLDRIYEVFAAAYPGIELQFVPLRVQEMVQRLLTEQSANREPDVDLLVQELEVAVPLVDNGLIETDIDWTALGVPDDVITESNMVRSDRIAIGLVYNTDELSADDLPDSWEDLVDPRWAGELVADPRGVQFNILGLHEDWGPEATLDYVHRLKDVTEPLLVEGGTAGMLTVASGERSVTTNGRSAETLEQQAAGAPLEIKYLDVVPVADSYQAVVEGAPHPNAAACFVGWTLSAEGQEVYEEVEFKQNDSIPSGAPEGVEVIGIETADDARAASELVEQIRQIWLEED